MLQYPIRPYKVLTNGKKAKVAEITPQHTHIYIEEIKSVLVFRQNINGENLAAYTKTRDHYDKEFDGKSFGATEGELFEILIAAGRCIMFYFVNV